MSTANNYTRVCNKCGKILKYSCYSSWHYANKHNSICKSCKQKEIVKRNYDLSILLDDSYISFYWVGFLLADASFYDNKLKIIVNNKDKEHINTFAKYINYSGRFLAYNKHYGLACKDIEIIKKLKIKFNILERKTYNPPKTISNFSYEHQIALLAGFIDGDGCIRHPSKNRKDFILTIKVHSSWLNILTEFNSLICDKNFCKINSAGYAVLTITNSEYLKKLKKQLLQLNLPLLNRKWDIIDLNYMSKYVQSNINKELVMKLYNNGLTYKEIINTTGLSKSYIYKIINKYKTK